MLPTANQVQEWLPTTNFPSLTTYLLPYLPFRQGLTSPLGKKHCCFLGAKGHEFVQ